MKGKDTSTTNAQKRPKVPQGEFPANALEPSLRVSQALLDHFAGKSAAPHDVAIALNLSPTSGGWRSLCGSSIAYGLTEGGYAAAEIVLTQLGRRIVAPEEDGDDAVAKREAIIRPRIMREFFEKYDRAKFPREDIAGNVLFGLGLPKERTDKAVKILFENGRYTGVVRETKTGAFVTLNGPSGTRSELDAAEAIQSSGDTGVVDTEDATQEPLTLTTRTQDDQQMSQGPKQIFVAHGRNRRPLEDLKKILDRFRVPYKVAVDEPHGGRPISQKVAELMKSCSAGIFVFTKDEMFTRGTDEEVWRPSENVVYELGAGSILWGKKIIILRENGVNFPSDFSDLGYITFENGDLASRGLEILGELVALEFVKIHAA